MFTVKTRFDFEKAGKSFGIRHAVLVFIFILQASSPSGLCNVDQISFQTNTWQQTDFGVNQTYYKLAVGGSIYSFLGARYGSNGVDEITFSNGSWNVSTILTGFSYVDLVSRSSNIAFAVRSDGVIQRFLRAVPTWIVQNITAAPPYYQSLAKADASATKFFASSGNGTVDEVDFNANMWITTRIGFSYFDDMTSPTNTVIFGLLRISYFNGTSNLASRISQMRLTSSWTTTEIISVTNYNWLNYNWLSITSPDTNTVFAARSDGGVDRIVFNAPTSTWIATPLGLSVSNSFSKLTQGDSSAKFFGTGGVVPNNFALTSAVNHVSQTVSVIFPVRTGYPYTLESATNLINWVTRTNFIAHTNATVQFIFGDVTNVQKQFFRARSP